MSDNAKTELLSIIETNKKNLARLEMIVKKHSEALHGLVVSSWKYPVAPKHFVEQCYAFVHDQSPICSRNNVRKFESVRRGYACCGKRCECAVEKKRNTMIDRYGCEFPLQSEQLKQKVVETCKIRYGVDSINAAGKEKRIRTCLERYGSTSPLGNAEILQKTRDSLKQSLGVENPLRDAGIRKRIQDAWIEKTGKKGFSRTKEHGEANARQYALENFNEGAVEVLFDREVFAGLLRTMSRVELSKHLNCSYALIDKRVRDFDLTEFRYHPSYYEILISNLLNSYSLDFVKNTRKVIRPKELDFYIPSRQFAIEFCGLRWHGEKAGRSNKYHLNKYLATQEKGIRLVQIFQDEWDNNSAAVKSTVLHQLQLSKTKVFARKTAAIEITADETEKFVQENSCLNVAVGSVNYGLKFKDQLVFVMSFERADQEWRVSALVSKIGTAVPGGAAKLFNRFVRDHAPAQVIAESDLRYFNGTVYEKLGFVYNTTVLPKSYFTKGVNRWFGEPETGDIESYDRIWDCGQRVHIWQK